MIADILPKIASVLFYDVISSREDSYVYLTFDDGPVSEATPNLLKLLDKHDAKVSFFFSGQNAANNPDLVRLCADSGHTICSHGFFHKSLMFASHGDILDDLQRANQAICDAIGQNREIRYFRPPYGRFGLSLISAVRQLNMKTVLWSYAPPDFRNLTSERIADRTVKNVKAGDIVLLHEREQTVNAMDQIISGLSNRGMELRGL